MRYAIFYGKDDATQAQEFATELRERKHKTLIVDSAVVKDADIEGDLDGLIFADNVDKFTQKNIEAIYDGIPSVLYEDLIETEDKENEPDEEKAVDAPSGDTRPSRVRETSRKHHHRKG
jgi:hypothetical protein